MRYYPTPAHDPAVEGQLLAYLTDLKRRAEGAFGPTWEAPDPQAVASDYVFQLQRDSDPHQGVADLMNVLDARSLSDRWFWGTPLGRAMAWHIGYYVPEVPPQVVACVLWVSRQRVAQYSCDVTDRACLRQLLRQNWSQIQDRLADRTRSNRLAKTT